MSPIHHATPCATPWPRARCSPRPRPRRWAFGSGPATTALITPASRRRLPSHASDRRRSWSVTPGVRPAVTLAYSARHDVGGGRAANPRPRPRPNSAARRHPLGDPTARWAARSWAAPASAPPDGDDGAPGWGRLRPASGGVDHRPYSRPPWLSTTGIVRGREGGATPGGGGGCGGGGRAGGGGVAMLRCGDPLRPRRGAAILAEGARELHRKRRTTNKRQSKVDEGWLSTRGSQFRAPTNPPKKDTSAVGIGGRGWQDSIWRGKEGPGTRLTWVGR
jgi:hypothetical protein